jgi:hypothetical protein
VLSSVAVVKNIITAPVATTIRGLRPLNFRS